MKYMINRLVRLPVLLILVTGAALLPMGKASAGTYSCSGPTVSSLNANMGGGSVAVGRDVAVGTAVTNWTSFTDTPNNQWTCTISNPNYMVDYFNSIFRSSLSPTGQNYSDGGYTYPIYPTNVPGIGVIMGSSSYESYAGYSSNRAPYRPSWNYGIGSSHTATRTDFMGFGISFRFIKIGAITGGSVAFASPVAYGAPGDGYNNPVGTQIPVTASNGPTFSEGTCTVADIDVPLGTHRPNEFTGVGTKVGVTDFTINVNNCPAGMNTVRYRLELAPGIPAYNAASGIVKLDTASTATGVAVQVMNRSNVAYNFSTMPWANITPTYVPATGGNYTIPLRAAYYQTAATVTPGPANSAVMFTMEYK